MYSPAWIMQERSFNTNHNDHSSRICSNDSGIYVVYQTENEKSDVTLFKLDLNGNYIWKQLLEKPVYDKDVMTSICCNNVNIFIAYQINKNELIAYKIECLTGLYVNRIIELPEITAEYVTVSTCCDILYVYMVFYINNMIYVKKLSTDDLTDNWLLPITAKVNANNVYNKAFICKNSRGLYIGYFADRDDDTYINVIKIFKNQIEHYDNKFAFNGTDKNINPSITCNVKNIFLTYHDLQHNIHVFKYNLCCNKEWKVIQENNSEHIYNLDPMLCCDEKYVFFSYYTNGIMGITGSDEPMSDKKPNSSDVVVFKINVDGGDIVACQFLNFNTNDNDIEPSICSDNEGVYVTYTTFGKVIGSDKKDNEDDSDIAVFKLNVNNFDKMKEVAHINKIYLYKYMSHKHETDNKKMNLMNLQRMANNLRSYNNISVKVSARRVGYK